MFRVAVTREFERLVCDGAAIAELPEVEEAESDGFTEAVAFAQA